MAWRCSSCGGENQQGMKFCGHCGTPAGEAAVADSAEREDRASAAPDVSEALKGFISQQVADHLVASGGQITEERRLVTALFADLSGFTPLADRLDPEELLAVIDPVIERLTNIVGRYEGYVDKFAGDALLAFFGAPISHEDDAQRALMVALEMHQAVAEMLPELPEDARELTLHIGVNTGRVVARVLGTDVRMDYSVLGDAVILAQRLQSAAGPGETLVGATTYDLTSTTFELEPVGELTLKGKSKPVPAFRLVQTRRFGRGDDHQVAFIGRENELATVDAVLSQLGDGTGSVISVSGEAGVGKSRFTAEVQRRAESLGALWLTARCLSYGAGIPYWPVSDLVRRLAGIEHDTSPADALARLRDALRSLDLDDAAPPLARMLGFDAPEVSDLEPEAYRRLLHESLRRSVERLTRDHAVVIVVEDVHWSDSSSVELFAELAALCAGEPVALYVTGRAEAMATLLQIAGGADEGVRHSIQLDTMDDTTVQTLIATLVGGRIDTAASAAIAERAAGNAFFVRELVRSLQETGRLVDLNGGWSLSPEFDPSSVPPTIEGVLAARIDALPRRASSTLQVSAVIGRRVRLPLLHAVERSADLERELDALVAAEMLERDPSSADELVFHHALVQDVAYSRLLRRRRRELHLKVAEEAEKLYGAGDDTIDLLARHLHLAGVPKAIDYLIRAGERAARLFANDEALIHFGHAADLARVDEDNVDKLHDVLLKIADLQELRGSYEEAFRLYVEVRDATGDIRAWRGLASSLRNQSRYDEVHRLLDEALALDRFSEPEKASLWLERGWTLVREGRFEAAADAFRSGLEAKSGETDLVTAELLLQLAGAETALNQLEDGLKHATEAVEIFNREGSIREEASAMRILGDAYRELGRHEEAARALKRGIDLAERTGNILEIGGCLINLGRVEMERHDLEQAIVCDRGAIEKFEQIGHPNGRAISYGNLAEKLLLHGDGEEAYSFAIQAKELGIEIDAPFVVADADRTLALIHIDKGEFEKGAMLAEEGAKIHDEIGFDEEAARSFELAADAWERAGRKERAPELRSRALALTPYRDGT